MKPGMFGSWLEAAGALATAIVIAAALWLIVAAAVVIFT